MATLTIAVNRANGEPAGAASVEVIRSGSVVLSDATNLSGELTVTLSKGSYVARVEGCDLTFVIPSEAGAFNLVDVFTRK